MKKFEVLAMLQEWFDLIAPRCGLSEPLRLRRCTEGYKGESKIQFFKKHKCQLFFKRIDILIHDW